MAFLPSPGIFERLGDAREKARDKAREALVSIGGFAFRSSPSGSRLGTGKGPESSSAMFERQLRDTGLSNKVWRVREQVSLLSYASDNPSDSLLSVHLHSRAHPSGPSLISHSAIFIVASGCARRYRW